MKSKILTLLTAVACGAMPLSALDATDARVTLKVNEIAVVGKLLDESKFVSLPGNSAMNSPVINAKYTKAVPDWKVISLPIRVVGYCGRKLHPDDKKSPVPHFVDKLTVKAHVLLDVGIPRNEKGEMTRKVKLSKEITYYDIPLKEEIDTDVKLKDNSTVGACEFSVDLFISPRNASKLNEKGPAPTNTDKSTITILAVALEATHRGVGCTYVNEKKQIFNYKTYSNNPKIPEKMKWVESSAIPVADGELLAVCETPFASYVNPKAPRATVEVAQSTRSSSSSSSSGTSYTPTIRTENGVMTNDVGSEDGRGTTAEGTDDTETATTTRSGRKNKKNSRSRRR